MRTYRGGRFEPLLSSAAYRIGDSHSNRQSPEPWRKAANGNATWLPPHDSGVLLLGDDHPLQYQALSYCWGPEGEHLMEFSYNDVSHSVGNSAFQALLSLRDPWLSTNIWIDAICIDQNSYMEKAFQIPRMRNIYANADSIRCSIASEDDMRFCCGRSGLDKVQKKTSSSRYSKCLQTGQQAGMQIR